MTPDADQDALVERAVDGMRALLTLILLARPTPAVVSAPDTAGNMGSMTSDHVANALGVSPATVRRLAREPGAPVVFVGASARWDIKTARKWLAARGRKPTAARRERLDPEVAQVVARTRGIRLAK